MNKLGRFNEKSWVSKDKNYEITVWMEKSGIRGELYERASGKRYTLNDAMAMDRDYPYFPSEVSENLNRLFLDLTKK